MTALRIEQHDAEAAAAEKAAVMEALNRHPFRPAWWLRNAHAQTVWSRYGSKATLPPLRLERWDTPDGDQLRMHFYETQPDAPICLILHGLEGSVNSTYAVRLMRGLGDAGWTVVTMEHRSCGGEMNCARRMYHSGETSDLDLVVTGLGERYPQSRVYVAGYSLGGNVTAKWLGECGDAPPAHVQGAAVVSAPYDLLASGPYVDSGVRRVYVRHFLRSLIPKAIAKAEQYPGILDVDAIRRARTFREFDHYATARLHGFASAEDYYAKVACGQFLHAIRRPTLLISAADDPFNPGHTLPHAAADASPWLYPQFTQRGGHVGFVSGPSPRRARFWAEEQIARFFRGIEARRS